MNTLNFYIISEYKAHNWCICWPIAAGGGGDDDDMLGIIFWFTTFNILICRLIHWRKTFLIWLRTKSSQMILDFLLSSVEKEEEKNKRYHYKHIQNIRVYRCNWPVLVSYLLQITFVIHITHFNRAWFFFAVKHCAWLGRMDME